MSEEKQEQPQSKLIFLDDSLGTQNDGEPVAVTESVVEEEPKEQEDAVVEDHQDEEEQPKKKTGSQRAREKAQRLEIENEILRRQLVERGVPKEEPKKAVSTDAPNPDDFEDHDAYIAARARYEVRQELQAEREKEESQRRLSSWQERVSEVKKDAEYDDFDDVVQGAPAPSEAVAAELLESPIGPKIAYYLGTNQDEYEKINRMKPRDAARAIWSIEQKLKEPVKAQPKTTSAPRPPTPVSGASATAPKLSKKGYEVGY